MYACYVPCPSKFDYVFVFFSRIIIIIPYNRDNELDRHLGLAKAAHTRSIILINIIDKILTNIVNDHQRINIIDQ